MIKLKLMGRLNMLFKKIISVVFFKFFKSVKIESSKT